MKKNNIFAQAYGRVMNAVVTVIENKSSQDYSFGKDDRFPNKLIDLVYDSGTATACVNKLSAFIEGDGFDEGVSSLKIAPDKTADELLSATTPYLSMFDAFAWKVVYNAEGKPAIVEPVEYEKIRRKMDGTFVFNKNMGDANMKKSDNIFYRPYNPETALEEIRTDMDKAAKDGVQYIQHGQLLYDMPEKPGQPHYTIPSYFSGIDDIRADAEISRVNYGNSVNAFRPDVIITMVGEIDNETRDSNGRTDQDKFDATLKSFSGANGQQSKVCVLTAKTREEIPSVQSYDAGPTFDATDKAEERIGRKVCRHFEVPPILIGFSTPGQLGNNQELANTIDFFNQSLLRKQNRIERAFKKVFPEYEWKIIPLQLVKYIPAEVWAKLTDDEIRAIGGYEPLPNPIIPLPPPNPIV